jgi:hypothetical protein
MVCAATTQAPQASICCCRQLPFGLPQDHVCVPARFLFLHSYSTASEVHGTVLLVLVQEIYVSHYILKLFLAKSVVAKTIFWFSCDIFVVKSFLKDIRSQEEASNHQILLEDHGVCAIHPGVVVED